MSQMRCGPQSVSVWLCCGVVLLGSVGCAPHRSQFPVLPLETDQDSTFNCAELENELLRANALRDAIVQEFNAVRLSDTTGDVESAAWTAVDPIHAVFLGVSRVGRREEYERYRQAQIAAEARLIHVLTLRESRKCRVGITADATRSERDLLQQVKALDQRFEEGHLPEGHYRQKRSEVLDAIR